ncbi:MAG: Cell division protein CpoB [Opitutales bacterium]
MRAGFYTYTVLTVLLGLLSACAPTGVEVVSETDEKQYQLAQDYKNQGRIEEALSAFLRVIDARRDAPESHLEAGYIYLRAMKDPVRAIYHFDRYLQFKPQSPQATQVRQLIETAQKEFARQLPAQPYQGELDRIDMMELVKTLKQENDSLKRDLVAAQRRVAQLENLLGQARRIPEPQIEAPTRFQAQAAAPAAPPASPRNPADVPRTYTVQSGDSLSTISVRFYGTSSRWIDIYQANRDRLPSENALRVGQEIRIP